MVFKVTTDPRYIVQWWGPRDSEIKIDKADVRSGGEWRYLHVFGGQKTGFHGVYHEVLAPERVIETFEWEGLPEKEHVILETAKYQELSGKRTKITIQQVFQ